jgi:hypothetical protein
VFMISAYGDQDTIIALERGANKFLTKDFPKLKSDVAVASAETQYALW